MQYIDNNPEYIVLYATTDCNHKCSHCFLEHNLNWDPSDLVRITGILNKKCLVHINGAEPLLHPEYLKAYKEAGQSFIFTNGLVFLKKDTPMLLKQLRDNGIRKIRLSHHFQATETLNSVPSVIVEQITKFLIDNGFEVHYNTTVTIKNYKNLEETCDRAYALGVKKIKFFPLKKIGNAKEMISDYGLSHEKMKYFYDTLREVRNRYDISELAIKVSGDLSGISNKFMCTYGKHSYAITPDMKVYGCVYAISNHPPIGYLLEDGTICINNEIDHDCRHCLLIDA